MTRKRTIGFTLVELLIVISIIGLLATILLPALSRAKALAYNAKCRAWVRSLADACTAYKLATQYYPGQCYPNQLAGTSGPFTGTQVMAASLYGFAYSDINTAGLVPPGRYMSYTPGDLANWNGRENTVSDRLSDARPVLYWPWRLGTNDMTQCKYWDNEAYINKDSKYPDKLTEAGFSGYAADPGVGVGMPYGAQAFMLVAAGIDRVFGTDDDIRCIPN